MTTSPIDPPLPSVDPTDDLQKAEPGDDTGGDSLGGDGTDPELLNVSTLNIPTVEESQRAHIN